MSFLVLRHQQNGRIDLRDAISQDHDILQNSWKHKENMKQPLNALYNYIYSDKTLTYTVCMGEDCTLHAYTEAL